MRRTTLALRLSAVAAAASMAAVPAAHAQLPLGSLGTGSLGSGSIDTGSLGSLGPGDPTACSTKSSPVDAGGWGARAGDSAGKHSPQAVVDDDGSIDLSRTAAADKTVSSVKATTPVKVSDAGRMSFQIKTTTQWKQGDTAINPNYVLLVDLDGKGTPATIAWEPLYNGEPRPGANPGGWSYPQATTLTPTADGNNGHWVAFAGGIKDAAGATVFGAYWPTFSLPEFQSRFPQATVTSYGVMNDSGATPATMFADNVTFGSCTTDFTG